MAERGDFDRMVRPLRGELFAHCYRMLGSVHDAEDLVQETYLRAWRSYHGFEGRSSVRTWLYRIATNACLTAREGRAHRPLPSGLGVPFDELEAPLPPPWGTAWLEPAPDRLFAVGGDDPAAIVGGRGSVRLAMIAALQTLTPRQCAVLILRDVLQWRAAEVAELLEASAAAVNSTLRRARARIELAAPVEDEIVDAAGRRELLDRYVEAVRTADTAALVGLLAEDAVWEMPPYPSWLRGRESIGRFIGARCPSRPGANILVPASANLQPAFGGYLRGADGVFRPDALQVLTLSPAGITHVVSFRDTSLFAPFGLPPVLEVDPGPHPGGRAAGTAGRYARRRTHGWHRSPGAADHPHHPHPHRVGVGVGVGIGVGVGAGAGVAPW